MSVRYFLLRTQILLAVCFVISGGQIDPCVSSVTLQTVLDLTKESLVNIRRVYRQCDKKDNPPSCYQEKAPRVKAYIEVALDLLKTVKRKRISCTLTSFLSTEQLNQLGATTETIEALLRTTSSPDIKHPEQTSETNSAEVNFSTTLSPDTTNHLSSTSSTIFVEINLNNTLSPDTSNQIGYMPSETNLEDNSLSTNSPVYTTNPLNQVLSNTNSIESSISTIASVDAGNPYNEELNNSLSPSTYDNSTIYPDFSLPMDCLEILQNGQNITGVYKIQLRMPEAKKKTLDVYCDMDTDGGGWTVIQKRSKISYQLKFSRNWTNYKYGFGPLGEDFWLGNQNMYFLTNQVQDQAIRLDLDDVRGNKRHATYNSFRIDNEENYYKLHISGYSGDAGDSMSNQNGWEFFTYDILPEECAEPDRGGWWFGSCTTQHVNELTANLNGISYPGISNRYLCTFWFHWLKYECLRFTEMKLRRI